MIIKINELFQPLETDRLLLRGFQPSDKQDLFEMRSNPIMCEHNDSRPELSIEDTEAYIEKMLAGCEAGKFLIWAITLKDSSKVIGTISIWNFNEDGTIAELGYGLNPSYHGKGYMTEALSVVVDFCLHILEMTIVEAYTEIRNTPSNALLLRSGFQHTGQVTDKGFYNDRDYIMNIYQRKS